MAAKLVVQAPGGQRHEFPLSKTTTTIGRGRASDLVLEYDYVSRDHAKVERTNDGYVLIDCGSTNGTQVNSRRVGEMQLLTGGDEIRVGEISIAFVDSAGSQATTAFFRPTAVDSPIRCDSSSWQVWIGDRLLENRLSLQEFELLSLLSSRYGRLCTREELGTAIWGRGNYDYNMLHRLVHRLKEKLGPEHGALIVSVAGKGYRLSSQLDASTPTPPASAGASFKTVLFTDVEGSTGLVQKLGDARAHILMQEVGRLTREALKAHGGTEIKTMGDGFMASFDSATRAVTCAVEIQNALSERNTSAAVPVHVRMGLNAGEPLSDGEDLFGSAVVTAARIADEADGDEVLVTDLVRQLVAGKGFLFADRGEMIPRGMEEPVRVWQVQC